MLSIRDIGVIGRTYRHLNRYRQILGVFLKYGFGDLLNTLKIDQYIEVGLQMISRKTSVREERLTRPQRVRLALEELGPTYIKLGQILSTRPDLIPAEFIDELALLQDAVPPFDFGEAEVLIRREFGREPTELFERIAPEPVASASIGQVHRAVLKSGEPVAVKFRRPGIRALIEVDLEIMLHLATLAERHVEELAPHRPVKIVEEFARTLEKEIDFKIEAANIERIAGHFSGDPTVYIPTVYREATTSRVLTTEYIEGIKISKIEELDAAGHNRRTLCSRGADLVLRQVFDHGVFHGDPHPGNIFALPGDVIGLVDFGIIGVVDRRTRDLFVDLVDAVVHRNESRTVLALLAITTRDLEPDLRQLEREVADFIGRHFFKPLSGIELGRILKELLALAAQFQLRIPPDLFLMFKALSAIESIGRSLDPEFDIFACAAPFIQLVKLERLDPNRIAEETGEAVFRLMHFVNQFPADLLELTRLIRQQRLTVQVENRGLERTLSTHDQISNRIAFAIIIAALIVGSAMIVISKTPPLAYDISLIGIIGFLAAAVMGIWLLVAILRSGRL
jgi:ubiquinone biosynthesis protein